MRAGAPAEILVTGATGLVGGETLARLLSRERKLHAWVLVRDADGWSRAERRLGIPGGRVTVVPGDLTEPGLGLDRSCRTALGRRVRTVLHAAADTCFSRPLDRARRVNVDGTVHLLELAEAWGVERFAHVSTAFVAGRRTGPVPEAELDGGAGWVNAYERSKHEAEARVRGSGLGWVVLRPSTIACEDAGGRVRQLNALHRALRLHHQGLASLLPGTEDTPVDLVTNDWVSGALAELALAPDTRGRTFHLCAGRAALPLGELLDRCHAFWRESPAWRRRAIARPALADLETYRLFERTVEETSDPRIRRITRALSWFVPQLALPKRFETAATEAFLGRAAPPIRDCWASLLQHLEHEHWSEGSRDAA